MTRLRSFYALNKYGQIILILIFKNISSKSAVYIFRLLQNKSFQYLCYEIMMCEHRMRNKYQMTHVQAILTHLTTFNNEQHTYVIGCYELSL